MIWQSKSLSIQPPLHLNLNLKKSINLHKNDFSLTLVLPTESTHVYPVKNDPTISIIRNDFFFLLKILKMKLVMHVKLKYLS